MQAEEYLQRIVEVIIDRPMGSKHPEYDFIYPVNYGFIPGEISPDEEELDVYVLGEFEPLNQFKGRCIAIIRRLDDDDDKLIVVSVNKDYTDDQIRVLTEFQERYYSSIIIRYKSQVNTQ